MTQVRNLTARSVVLSTLLGTRPPVLPVRVLVRAGELFGISEGTLRVALSRMLAAGEVEAFNGSYRLAGRLLERQVRQEASREGAARAWRASQPWRFAFVHGWLARRSAADRSELRTAMRALRMAELREGVWLRPDNLALAPSAVVAAQCVTAVGSLDDGVDPVALAARLWDVEGWAAHAHVLRHRLAQSTLSGPAELAPGFVLSADVLRHFQADPLLPAELLPANWPGPALRDAYAEWDSAYRALLRSWWRAE